MSCDGSVAVPVSDDDDVAVGSVKELESVSVRVGIEYVFELVLVSCCVSVSVPVSVAVFRSNVFVAVEPPEGRVWVLVMAPLSEGRVIVFDDDGRVTLLDFVAEGIVNVPVPVGSVTVLSIDLVEVPLLDGSVIVFDPVGRVSVASWVFVAVACTVLVVVKLVPCPSAKRLPPTSRQSSEARIARRPVSSRTSSARALFERKLNN